MGTKLPFCILRGTTFYWRRRLPSPFKMSVEFSLGTKDLRVARGLSSMLTIETASRRTGACPRLLLSLTPQVFCVRRIRAPDAGRIGYSVRPMGLRVTDPVAGKAVHIHDGRDRRSLRRSAVPAATKERKK